MFGFFNSSGLSVPVRFSGQIKSNSHVLLSVSIGEADQTGDCFRQMVDLVLQNKDIHKVTLLKADTLQRFRIMLENDVSEEKAISIALERRMKWEDENKATLDLLREHKGLDERVWDDFRLCDEMADAYKKIQSYYEENKPFKHATDGLTNNFCRKFRISNPDKYKHDIFFNILLKYVIEECAAKLVIANRESCEYEIYRNGFNRAMQIIHKKFVTPGHIKEISIQSVHTGSSSGKIFDERANGLFFNSTQNKPEFEHYVTAANVITFALMSNLNKMGDSSIFASFINEFNDFVADFKQRYQENQDNSASPRFKH